MRVTIRDAVSPNRPGVRLVFKRKISGRGGKKGCWEKEGPLTGKSAPSYEGKGEQAFQGRWNPKVEK